MDDIHGVNADVLRVQLRARRTMKREVIWFYAAILGGTVTYYGFGFPSLVGLLAYLGFILVIRTAMVRYQWWFLRRFDLSCPYCQKPLGVATSYVKSPSHNCLHCGRQALAPIRQLREFEKANS